MRRVMWLLVGACVLINLGGMLLPASAEGWAQVMLQNDTSVALDLYVDGVYGCRALAHLTCTTQVSATATHTLMATDGIRSTSTIATIDEGTSPVWQISEQ